MSVDAFEVSWGSHLLSGFVHHTPLLWKALGRLESWTLRATLNAIPVEQPTWITGLARSGSTVLLEILASHPEVATHQYRDFPFVAIPYWWRSVLANAPSPPTDAVERAHGDRLLVTPSSPEAMEEPLWMAHFDHLHDRGHSAVLDVETSNPTFEAFFADHVRKLLHAADRGSYVAKANYNITRLGYLQRQFADARFVVPVRDPRTHIASLRKQHRLFERASAEHPRAVAHLDRVGHFEFGPHRTPIVAGDPEIAASVEELWRSGEEVRGWARYWAHVYGLVARQIAVEDALREAVMVVRYEDLCATSRATLEQIFAHVGLSERSAPIIDEYAVRLSPPSYYSVDFTDAEQQAIAEECGLVAGELGYDLSVDMRIVATADTPRIS